MTHKVRVRMFPDREIEVNDAELVDLERQGLLVKAAPKPSRAGSDDSDDKEK